MAIRTQWRVMMVLAVALPMGMAGQDRAPLRRAVGQVISSDSLPRLRVTIDSAFEYLGHTTFAVGDKATAERFVFAEVRSGRVERAVIVHFEHFHPDNSSRFGYPPEPTAVLGENTYLHQNWWLEADFFARPDLDSLLKHHAFQVDTLHASDRYVRVVDESAKHEVILFYLERSALLPGVGRIAPSAAGNIPREAAQALGARARRAFRVED